MNERHFRNNILPGSVFAIGIMNKSIRNMIHKDEYGGYFDI